MRPLPSTELPPPVPTGLVRGPAAGWYPDPWAPGAQRFWDGAVWTGLTSPAPSLESSSIRPGGPDPTLPLPAAVGALAVTAASLVGTRFLLEAFGQFAWPIIAYVAISAVAGYGPMVAYCVWASRRWATGALGVDLGLRFRWLDAAWGPLTWLAAIAGQITIGAAILAFDVPVTSNTESLNELRSERGVLISLLITAVVVAPLVEEMVFRGLVLRGLRSALPTGLAIGVQAVLFGVAHIDPARGMGNIGLALVLSVVGGVLGVSAHLLRRIGPTVVAHGILNAIVMCYVLLVS